MKPITTRIIAPPLSDFCGPEPGGNKREFRNVFDLRGEDRGLPLGRHLPKISQWNERGFITRQAKRKTLLIAIVGLACTALVTTTQAQVNISIGAEPGCPYGYYDVSPYG